MPGGKNAVGYPPDPDEAQQIEIIIEALGEWFPDLDEDDIADAAADIQDQLHDRSFRRLGIEPTPSSEWGAVLARAAAAHQATSD